MSENRNTYYSFSDESNITASRFVSISAITVSFDSVEKFHNDLDSLLNESNVSEFKWKKLASAKYRFAAMKIIDYVTEQAIKEQIRIDTLIWDTKDKRHSIIGRDDIQNFERMFFHLHNSLMRRQGPSSRWHIRPDERTDLNWGKISECLHSKSLWKDHYNYPLLEEFYSTYCYQIDTFKQMNSASCRLNQIADLFAGMGAYSRHEKMLIKSHIQNVTGQKKIFQNTPVKNEFSNADEERLNIILYLNNKCKQKKLGVSLRTLGYLKTYEPSNPINFWHYEPQHGKDRAPVKN